MGADASCLALNAVALGESATSLGHLRKSLRTVKEIRQEGGTADALDQSVLVLLCRQHGEDKTACECARRALNIDHQVGHRYRKAFTLDRPGSAVARLGQLERADGAYRQALDLWHEMGGGHLAREPLAGLALVALARDDAAAALAHMEEILGQLETGGPSTGSGCSIDGTDEPLRIYLTCYRVLRVNRDPRADADASHRCTLRAAVQETNTLEGADTLILPSGIYTLTIAGVDEDLAATGDLDIVDGLTISGAGAWMGPFVSSSYLAGSRSLLPIFRQVVPRSRHVVVKSAGTRDTS